MTEYQKKKWCDLRIAAQRAIDALDAFAEAAVREMRSHQELLELLGSLRGRS